MRSWLVGVARRRRSLVAQCRGDGIGVFPPRAADVAAASSQADSLPPENETRAPTGRQCRLEHVVDALVERDSLCMTERLAIVRAHRRSSLVRAAGLPISVELAHRSRRLGHSSVSRALSSRGGRSAWPPLSTHRARKMRIDVDPDDERRGGALAREQADEHE